MKKIKVFVQDKFVKSHDFSPDMLLAYLGLRLIIIKGKNEYFVSTGLLSYSIFGLQMTNQLITKLITNGVKQLIANGIVIHTDKDKKSRTNEYILDLSQLPIDPVKSEDEDDFYSSVELDCILTIIQSKLKEKLDLFRFYCYLITTVSKTGDKVGVGFTSYNKMASEIGMCRQTVSKYMDLLENFKIISIYRSTDAVIVDGVITEISNTYGSYSYKDNVVKVGSTYECNYGENSKRIKSTKDSSTRSASAKYRRMINELDATGEIIYEYDELKDIYNTLLKYNAKYKYDNSLQKDLSVFSSYDFYNE